MKKEQINIERTLRSKAGGIIWGFISEPHGLSRWLADDVTLDGDLMTFTWGDPLKEHETRTARVLEVVKNCCLKLRWIDDEDPDSYLELRMSRSDLTGDYLLAITDFAQEDDTDSMIQIWEDNLERLHRASGLL